MELTIFAQNFNVAITMINAEYTLWIGQVQTFMLDNIL